MGICPVPGSGTPACLLADLRPRSDWMRIYIAVVVLNGDELDVESFVKA